MDKAVFRNHLTSDSRRSSHQIDKITFSHKVEQEHISERKLKGYTDQAGREIFILERDFLGEKLQF